MPGFSVPYIIMELPMNLLMKRIGANITLPLMVTLWGMVTACQGNSVIHHIHSFSELSHNTYIHQELSRPMEDFWHAASFSELLKVFYNKFRTFKTSRASDA